MSSKSSSKSTTSQTTQNIDKRIASGEGSVIVTEGASLEINQPFSDQVRDAYLGLIDMASKAGERASESMQTAVSTAAAQAAATLNQLDRTQKGDSTIYTDIFPYIAIGAVVLGIFFIGARK